MFAGVDLLLDQLDKLLEVAAEEARLDVLRRAMATAAAASAEAEITDTGAVCCVNCLSFPIDAVRLHDLGSAAVADVGQVAVRAAEISESEAAGCVNRLPSLSEDGFEAARRTSIGAASEMFGARLAAAVDEDEEQLRRAMATDEAEKEEARRLHKLKMAEAEVFLAAPGRAEDSASATIGAAYAPLLSSLSLSYLSFTLSSLLSSQSIIPLYHPSSIIPLYHPTLSSHLIIPPHHPFYHPAPSSIPFYK